VYLNPRTRRQSPATARATAVIDLASETTFPLTKACGLVEPARAGAKTHISTLVRWITVGARGPGGQRIRLEAVRLGGRWLTSREALQRFADRLTPQLDQGTTSAPTPRTPTARQRAAERAAKELERCGI
jgi:hypothetical protein